MLSEQRFINLFRPQENMFMSAVERQTQCVLHAAMYQPDGLELKHVKKIADETPRKIWTVMDILGNDFLVSGYQYAKREGYRRLGYVVTSVGLNEGVEHYVPMEKQLP